MSAISILHDHPVVVFFSGIGLLAILQNEKARVVASLVTFIIVIAAAAQIVNVDLKF